MAKFRYTAEKTNGEIYNGAADANDRFELYETIRREGAHLISFKEETAGSKYLNFRYWSGKIGSVKEQEKILLARNLGSMLKAGLPLSRAIAVIERQTKSDRLRTVVEDVGTEVRHGKTLHEAFLKYPRVFSKLMVAMVRAGEEGGDLASSLLTTADQIERSSDLKKKVKGALIYPMIILVAIFGIGAVMMVAVVPTLSKTFEEMGSKLPLSTRFVVGLSNFLSQNTLLAILIVLGSGLFFYFGGKTKFGMRAKEFIFLHTPLINEMVKEVNAARTARTLATLLTAGVDVLAALEITGEVVQNSYFQDVLKEAKENVRQGHALSETFVKNEKLFPVFVGEMMSVGEETGQTPQMMKQLAEYYEIEVDRKTKNMTTIIEPFLMLFIGVVVGFFAISMITPIYQISQGV